MPWGIVVGGLISGIGSYMGNKSRSDASSDAAQLNYDASMESIRVNKLIADMNLAAEQGRWEDMMALAEMLREEEKLGSTDAFGNSRYFDENLGWITDVHPTSQRLIDATMRQATQDATVVDRHNREREQRMAEDQRDQGFMADRLMSEYQRSPRISSGDLQSLMDRQGMAGYNDAMDRQQAQAMTAFTRQRNQPAAQQWMNDRASSTARDLADQRSSNALAALTGADEINNARRSDTAQQYFGMANNSVQPWTQFGSGLVDPTSVGDGNLAGANSLLNSLASQKAPQQDYVQANFAPGNLAFAQGNASANNWENITGLFGSMAPDIYDWYKDRQLNNDLDDLMRNDKLF